MYSMIQCSGVIEPATLTVLLRIMMMMLLLLLLADGYDDDEAVGMQ